MKSLHRFKEFTWEGIEVRGYKPEAGTHRDVTRQELFGSPDGLPCDLRYFEVGAGGHTTLERHEHPHAVLILRGEGRALIGDQVHDVRPFDALRVSSGTWHQFRAADAEPLGFLCLVHADRDRPVRPSPDELEALRSSPTVARFIRT